MATEGDLKDIALPSLVQMMCHEHYRAALVLKRERDMGIIYFDNGDVVHAETGVYTGEEAFYRLMMWNDGVFRLHHKLQSLQRTVTAPWKHLLMEGMRRIDEEGETEQAEQSREREPVTEEEIQSDATLESNLIVLLSGFDQAKDRLRSEKKRKQPALSLETLTSMVNEIVDFCEYYIEENKSTLSLSKALQRAGDLYPRANLLHVHNNRFSEQSVASLYKSWKSNREGRQETFRDVALGMIDILNAYFDICLSCFYSSTKAGQCRKACSFFITDFTGIVEAITY